MPTTVSPRVKTEDGGVYRVSVRGNRNDGGVIDNFATITLSVLGMKTATTIVYAQTY